MSYIDNRPLAVLLTALLSTSGRPLTKEELDQFIRSLLAADWDSPESPIRLNENLTLSECVASAFFNRTRVFLRVLDEDKGIPLTTRGNINRAGVTKLVERMDWSPDAVDRHRRILGTRPMNEEDFQPLHVIRVVSECANLTFKRRGRLFAARKAHGLCEDAAAGILFRHLFIAFFRRFSLDYLSGLGETPSVQDSIAVILWRLALKANDWISADKLPPEVFLPQVSRQITQCCSWPGTEVVALVFKVLQPLCWFGLLECDTPEEDYDRRTEDEKFRKTPLFDRFLTFVGPALERPGEILRGACP